MTAKINSEPMPRWLEEWTPKAGLVLKQFLASRVVFYPGSGTDGQPVEFFGSRHLAHCFVYVDYGISRGHVAQELGEGGHPFLGYHSVQRLEVNENALTPHGWTRHLRTRDAPMGAMGVETPYAFMEILEREPAISDNHGPQRLALLILCADGVAAYDALFWQERAGVGAPYAIVLQDHGFGGNWTRFGRGGHLEQLAIDTGRFPDVLLVAENTDAWDQYSKVAGQVAGGGGMHHFRRQLWRFEGDTAARR